MRIKLSMRINYRGICHMAFNIYIYYFFFIDYVFPIDFSIPLSAHTQYNAKRRQEKRTNIQQKKEENERQVRVRKRNAPKPN